MLRTTVRRAAVPVTALLTGLALGAVLGLPSSFAAPGDPEPPPSNVGTDIPLTYQGPAPSQTQKELVGPYQLLRSGTIDQAKRTITLPLYRGRGPGGKAVWYVLTDTTDKANAEALGLNHSAKLAYAVGRAVRPARLETDGTLTFRRGRVDFAPERKVQPAAQPNAFPPTVARPGSVGDRDYTPLARLENAGGEVYNAPVIAYDVPAERLEMAAGKVDHRVVHDKVVAISAKAETVTLALTLGFSFGKPILYLSTEANQDLPAALEAATLAPGLREVRLGADDGAFSPVERLFTVTNGATGKDNPQRQGFNSALSGDGDPLNIFGGIPTVATDYSPLWDLNVGRWTDDAIAKGYRSRLTEEFQYLGFVQRGQIVGPDGGTFGSSGFVVNCPPVFRFL